MACGEVVGGTILPKTLDGVKAGSKAFSVNVRGSSCGDDPLLEGLLFFFP